MPCGAGTWLEGDGCAGGLEVCGLIEQHIDFHFSGEPCIRACERAQGMGGKHCLAAVAGMRRSDIICLCSTCHCDSEQ